MMNYKVIKNNKGESILVRDIPKVEEPKKTAPKKTVKKTKEVVVE